MIETCPCGGEPHVRTDCPHYGLPTDAAGDVEIWKAMDMEITKEDRCIWVEGRDAVINFRAEFCGAPTLETVLGDMENYTEYAEECEALADRVRIASEQAVLAKLRNLPRDIALQVSSEVQKSVSALLFADNIKTIASALADALEGKQS